MSDGQTEWHLLSVLILRFVLFLALFLLFPPVLLFPLFFLFPFLEIEVAYPIIADIVQFELAGGHNYTEGGDHHVELLQDLLGGPSGPL